MRVQGIFQVRSSCVMIAALTALVSSSTNGAVLLKKNGEIKETN